MNKRIFKAANIQDAIASIKQELGPDAMILSTRKIPRKPQDPYAGEMIEVEAGLKNPSPWETEHEPEIREPARDLLSSVREDIVQIKDMISIAGFGSGIKNIFSENFENMGVLASFLRAGVSEKLACSLIERAGRSIDPGVNNKTGSLADPEKKIRQMKRKVMEICLDRISVTEGFKENQEPRHPHAAAFVGPTGVGKTTTIAKLAAFLSFKKKKRVGLISIDNFRIGAFEQLKAYGSIMGLPCIQAYNARDLSNAMNRMKSMDTVLIDTAGHSHHDREKLDEIVGLIRADFSISVHLTLSVTSELINMKEAASAFSALDPDTYVFTKIDETRRCGKILDQLNDYHLPVSLLTDGQKVPEDLIVPDRQTLLKIILGKGPGYGIQH
ncbi:flagellar biosynthesis protein FlhF [Desulfospira joergensenii]|uniref:flagellar biosynthesis protein FlhF n=1 Tax=Desulfospira joergensenii TaxID=53329 RepID=UPI0003B78D5B|nr:flagellar biosynthesis protein FlhF [Desulfospira joergensenii]